MNKTAAVKKMAGAMEVQDSKYMDLYIQIAIEALAMGGWNVDDQDLYSIMDILRERRSVMDRKMQDLEEEIATAIRDALIANMDEEIAF